MTQISVVIPAHNVAQTIENTLLSLLSDSELIGEIIIIDDRSQDGSGEIANQFATNNKLPLKVIPTNSGSAGAARNRGIDEARFRFVFFIDADDAVTPNGLSALLNQFYLNPSLDMVLGSSVRQTRGLENLKRIPSGFGADPVKNAENYLLNAIPPISMGSAIIRKEIARGIRFPHKIGLDEDTWFWSAILCKANVASISTEILNYNLDADRMAARFTTRPRSDWLAICKEFNQLKRYGVSKKVISWRKAWLAQRFARYLRKGGRYKHAAKMMRPVLAHKSFHREWRTLRYLALNKIGSLFEQANNDPMANLRLDKTSGSGHRTIILSYDPITPPISGSELRTYQIASSLSKLGPTLTVSVRPNQSTETKENFARATLTKVSDSKTASINKWRCSIEPRLSARSLERLKTKITEFKPQTIVVVGAHLGAYITHMRPLVGQIIIDMQNIESELLEQITNKQKLGIRSKIDQFLLRRLERGSIKLSDRIWICTEADKQRLFQCHSVPKPVHVVKNPIPRFSAKPEKLPNIAPNIQKEPSIFYIGHLGYMPNVDAVERLITCVFPIVQKTYPKARLLIAGRYPKPSIRQLTEQPSIELFENPEHLDFLFERAHISIIPLAFGGGSRLKILEIASMGIPIVASPLAAEGLGLENRKEISLGEGDQQLANSACELIRDPVYYDKIRTAAFHHARKNFNPKKIDDEVKSGLGFS